MSIRCLCVQASSVSGSGKRKTYSALLSFTKLLRGVGVSRAETHTQATKFHFSKHTVLFLHRHCRILASIITLASAAAVSAAAFSAATLSAAALASVSAFACASAAAFASAAALEMPPQVSVIKTVILQCSPGNIYHLILHVRFSKK